MTHPAAFSACRINARCEAVKVDVERGAISMGRSSAIGNGFGNIRCFAKSFPGNGRPASFEPEREVCHLELHLSRVRWSLVFGYKTVPMSRKMWYGLAAGLDPYPPIGPFTIHS